MYVTGGIKTYIIIASPALGTYFFPVLKGTKLLCAVTYQRMLAMCCSRQIKWKIDWIEINPTKQLINQGWIWYVDETSFQKANHHQCAHKKMYKSGLKHQWTPAAKFVNKLTKSLLKMKYIYFQRDLNTREINVRPMFYIPMFKNQCVTNWRTDEQIEI